jgi:hypothetical protein
VEVFSLRVLVDGEPSPANVFFSRDDCFAFSSLLKLTEGTHEVAVLGFGSRGSLVDSDSVRISVVSPLVSRFVRGDVDASGRVAVTDAVRLLLYLYRGRSIPCLDAADVDDDGQLGLQDAFGILRYLFVTGLAPRPPYPEAGRDPSEDELGCVAY